MRLSHPAPNDTFPFGGFDMNRIAIGVALVALALSPGRIAASEGMGSVCIAPAEKPTNGFKSLSNPSGGNSVQAYAVQIDKRPAVDASTGQGVKVGDLPLGTKHLVKVTGDGKDVTAFRFRFADYGSHDLCLWSNPLYETWSLTAAKGHGKSCICH
jgi:hypothetical protein